MTPTLRLARRLAVVVGVLAAGVLAMVALDGAQPRPLTSQERSGGSALADGSAPAGPALPAGPAPSPGTTATAEPPVGAPPDPSAVRALAPAGDGQAGASDGATPISLDLPSLGVAGAPVVPVGIAADGALEIPGPRQVGWYRLGPGPGGPGSIVLAAHVAYDGVDGVFRHLASVEPGATVSVATGDGLAVSYQVTDVDVYAKTELPIDELFDPNRPERLVLITCGGDFNPGLRHYDSNVVVVATPAGA